MKQSVLLLTLVLVGLFIAGSATVQAQKKMGKGKQAIVWPADDIKWDSLGGGPPGVMNALLWGNMQKGPFGILIKFPAGLNAPLHHHSANLKLVVIKGAYIYIPENGAEKRLGPGSYLFEPSGDRHATKSAEDSETIFYCEGDKMFDIVMENAPAGDKK